MPFSPGTLRLRRSQHSPVRFFERSPAETEQKDHVRKVYILIRIRRQPMSGKVAVAGVVGGILGIFLLEIFGVLAWA